MQQKIEHTSNAVLIIGGAPSMNKVLDSTSQLSESVKSCMGVIHDLRNEVAEYTHDQFREWQVQQNVVQ